VSANERAMIWLELRNARAVIAELNQTSGAVKRLRIETDAQGVAAERSAGRTWLQNQALFTLRRFAYAGSIALGFLGGAAISMGLKFDAAMESNTIVLGQFLGSTAAARRELGFLYRLAATGPFEFQQVTSAARQFLAMGFNIRQTNTYLRTLSDTAAGLQLGGEGVERLVVIFGQIRASGRLLGQDMRQLQQAGINTFGILRRELGLTQGQIQQLQQGQLEIPADIGIPALMAGLARPPSQGGFGGLSTRLQGTWQALTSTVHDYASQLFGMVTRPLFLRLEGHMKRLIVLLPQLNAAYRQGGFIALVRTLDEGVGAGGALVHVFMLLSLYVGAGARIFRTALLPSIRDVATVTGAVLYPALLALGYVLSFASHHTTLFRIVLTYLLAVYTAERIALGTLWILKRRNAVANLFMASTTGVATAAEALYTLWVLRAEYAQLFAARATRLWTVTMVLFTRATRLAALGMVLFNLALYANPIGLIVAAVVVLIGIFALLYWKVAWFRHGVNAAFDWIRDHWRLLLPILTGPIGLAAVFIIDHFRMIRVVVTGVINFIVGKIEWLEGKLTGLWRKIPGHGIIGSGARFALSGAKSVGGVVGGVLGARAFGGPITRTGAYLVGERGPELAMLPAGSAVLPLHMKSGIPAVSAPHMKPEIPPFNITVKIVDERPIELNVDGRKMAAEVARHRVVLAEAVASAKLDTGARS